MTGDYVDFASNVGLAGFQVKFRAWPQVYDLQSRVRYIKRIFKRSLRLVVGAGLRDQSRRDSVKQELQISDYADRISVYINKWKILSVREM
jgi:hypothetical protein